MPAVLKALNRTPTRWVVGLAASAVTSARGERAWITYDARTGGWLKRTAGGITVIPDPREMSAEECEQFTRDVFLHDYVVRPGDVVLDVGAGIGTETLCFSSMVGESGRVISVEAHPATFAMLQRMCQLNGLRNVELVHAAVMDSDEPVSISDLQGDADAYLENKVGAGNIRVPGTTIDGLLTRFGLDHVDFLKMNIEGAEAAALRGPGDVLARVVHAAIGCHDFLADETGDESYRTRELVGDLLATAGFAVTSRAADGRPWLADYLYASR